MSTRRRLLSFFSILVIVTMLFSGLSLPSASAQGPDEIDRQLNAQTGKVSFISSESGQALPAADVLGDSRPPQDPAMALARRFGPEFGLQDPQRDLQQLTADQAEDGRLTVRYQQHYQGIPVMGGELIVNTNANGDLYSMNGEVSSGLSLSTQPTIDSTTARQTARKAMAKWYQKSPRDFVVSEPELWIYDESLLQPSSRPAELVWRMEVKPKDAAMPVRELVLVNAQRGSISLHFNQIDTAWTVSGSSGTTQDPDPTPSPFPTETSLPTEPSIPSETPVPTGTPTAIPTDVVSTPHTVVDEVTILEGAIWYVATTGSDLNSCASADSPCETINGAIGKAAEGDTIKIAIGTYTGTGAEVVLINKSITLSGGWDASFTTQSGWSTIDGQGARRGVTSTGVNVVIDHFSIQNGFHENQGGGLRNYGGPLTLSNSVVSGNISQWMGGGIFNYGTLIIDNTIISDNIAGKTGYSGGGGGAGIDNYYGTVTLNNSTVNNNTILGGYSGSGINTVATLVLNNSTVSGNTGGSGEGIYTFVGTITVNNSTIAFNGSYGFRSQAGTVTLQNTIIASNGAGRDCYNDISYSGTVTSQGHNLIGNGSACTLTPTTGDQVGSDANPIKPRLTPLLETSETTFIHALLPDSPAIDAANLAGCPATDQRGVSRPVGAGCDIGAFEYNPTGTIPAYISVYQGSSQDIQINSPASSPLGAVVLDQNGDSVSNINVTFTAPNSGASAIFTDTGTNTATVVTDANGIATVTLSANGVPGMYTVTAAVAGLASTADFQLKNIDTINPASISMVSGSVQSAALQSPFSQRLKAKVRNSLGQPLSGKTVTFTAPASGASGTFATTHTNVSTAVTDANGIATSPAFTANNTRGSYVVKATVSGVGTSANFQLINGLQAVKTYTAKNSIALPGTLLCTQTKPNCTSGANPHADAAHRYAIGTSQLYTIQHGRNSIDNRGMTIISTVHFYSGYANAFWTGKQMVYGDAYGFPKADDVVAHELTHGVTQYASNLFYYYQSGAINESFSDLWGEFYDQTNGKGNDTSNVKWLMGEDVTGLGAIRSMSSPPWFGDPDKMSSTYYYEGEDDNGGVHTNSGINNKAVYLIVDGGSFNGKAVTPLGWTKTAAIYYEVNRKLLSSGADYSDLYYALQKACANLVGQKGITTADCVQVKNALDAVEMNGQPASSFNTDAPLCAAGSVPKVVFADNLERVTAKWTFKNGAYPRWRLDSPYGPYAKSGKHSLYADDYPGTVTDATARLAPVFIPKKAFLHFAHAYGFETGYYSGAFRNFDGGVLEYSTNGGTTWKDAGSLINFNGYKGKLFTGSGNPLSGRSAFVGDSHGYISTRVNLASLAGKKVSFRWRMGLDEFAYDWGWWVDNVKIYTCIPNPGAFNKTAPSNGATGVALTTTLSWSSSLYATSYQYCYDTINDNQCNATWSPVTTASVGISSLGANTTYYWQVRASNKAGTIYADNQTWSSFTTLP